MKRHHSSSAQQGAYYKTILEAELVRRSEQNHRYSLRAMARALKLQPGALSQILSGKRVPSLKMAQKILASLEMTPAEQSHFIESLAKVQRSRGLERMNPAFRNTAEYHGNRKTARAPKDLSLEIFRVVGDWYHYAIMMLTYVKDFDPNPNWIAARLGITPLEAKLAVDRMLELELLKRENDTLICWENHFTTADKHLTNSALKRRHKQILEKSLFSLENDAIETRNHNSMTMAIDPEKIADAKKMIEAFTNQLCEFLESGKRTQVYELNIGLFPLQKNASSGEPAKRGKGS